MSSSTVVQRADLSIRANRPVPRGADRIPTDDVELTDAP
jgi:hypothetical protein